MLVDVLRVVDDDYGMAVTIAELCRCGSAFGIAAAVHAARPNLMLPEERWWPRSWPRSIAGSGAG
ncbi:hypothetical protein BN159_3850 [Streptomyces davaonensis JCM 4913]|uniref:Uncharacterized protein n=1 Tax=Streptomyces davaonensis (strain DSM 101723 / JCM 4913 / KCC S-0913 / 768) TaxID=1214101 RepID=K4R691_STRDJ|nr:hypothetical protein BN159_3850 [Streptomyces davaonensis JCM 4913]